MNYTRIAVVGCGFYAQNHLNAWNDLKGKGAKLVSVCDLDHKKAKVAGENLECPFTLILMKCWIIKTFTY